MDEARCDLCRTFTDKHIKYYPPMGDTEFRKRSFSPRLVVCYNCIGLMSEKKEEQTTKEKSNGERIRQM